MPRFCISFIIAATCAFTPSVIADERVFTQEPAIAPAMVRGAAANPAADTAPKGVFEKGPAPLWIWGADINKNYFLRTEFVGGSTAARLRVTCDNEMTVWLNGKEVAESETWERPVEADVQKFVNADKNVLVARIVNHGSAAGFILKLALTMPNGETRFVVTDEKWQVAEKKDADKWVAARKIAKLGEGPWGDAFMDGGRGSANPSNVFIVLPGFQVERLFTVPKATLGSWVSLTTDGKGRLIASDQDGKGLCRITPPRSVFKDETKVERLNVKISAAQGMLWAFDSLYLSVNGGPGSGLYRLRSTTGDDQFDEVKKLATFRGGGEHGPHGLRLSPDGKSIFVVCGNHTLPPQKLDASRIPTNWAEDLLLPRQWDANGHAAGIYAPGGWIAKTDPEGKTWEMFSIGYRNCYDIAFNADGELFTYDSDMEWDMGMPWYRPTRVVHATSGSEFGWRSGTGVWPDHYIDSLPPLLAVGPGSPVGMEFGYGTKFPAKYQKALYCCDWTFGTIYAIHLEPHGSTYRAAKEEFLSRTPLPLTDIAVGADGALYFIIGGRGAQSELFRVTYIGTEPTDRVEYRNLQFVTGSPTDRETRHKIEAFHKTAADPAKAVEFVYSCLASHDRFERYAARVALEHQPVQYWRDRVLGESRAGLLIDGAVALARQGNRSIQPNLLAALDRIEFQSITLEDQLELLRVYALTFIRMGEPDKDTAARLAKKFDAFFPAKSDMLNRELCSMLVYLKSPTIVAKCIELIKQPSKPPTAEDMAELLARNRGYGGTIAKTLANQVDLQKFHYAFALRNVREGWTMEQRKVYFQFLNDCRQKSGGASFQGFINNTEKDAFANATDAERLAIEAMGLRKPYKPKELPKPRGPGREWKLDELVKFAEPKMKGRNFKNGEKMYAAARCIVCHRFQGDGGATGPDLSQVAGRFNLKDLCESIVEPSKVISDQYKASIVSTKKGKDYTGRIVSETNEAMTILLDPEDSTKIVELKKTDLEESRSSPISTMPADLLKALNDDEVMDLLAYLLSRGDRGHAMFRK